MRTVTFMIPLFVLAGCVPPYQSSNYRSSSATPSSTVCTADYSLSLLNVERPEKASQRYGPQKIDTISAKQYRFYFEDDLVRILWSVSSRSISFSIQNKTDHSIKIPWDEASYIDEAGSSHRVMHSGIKYTDRQSPQAGSVIARKASLEDLVFPTDYVSWDEGTTYTAGKWDERPLLPDLDFQSIYIKHYFSSFEEFDKAAKSKIGKTMQVLLPLQIEEVINDYIFTFKVDSVTTQKEVR